MRFYPDTDEEPFDVAQFELDREQAAEDTEADRFEYLAQFDTADEYLAARREQRRRPTPTSLVDLFAEACRPSLPGERVVCKNVLLWNDGEKEVA